MRTPPAPPPVRLQLLAIIREEDLFRAAVYDPDSDRILVVAAGQRVGTQLVDQVDKSSLTLRDERGARVLALQPEIILLDEPTSGLDPISTGKVEAALVELKKEYTIILAPHSVQQAGRTADYAAFFLQGELIEYGEGKSLFTAPKQKRTEDYVTGRFG